MKFFVVITDFVSGGGLAGRSFGFDSLEDAKQYAKLLTKSYTIIKGDVVEKKY